MYKVGCVENGREALCVKGFERINKLDDSKRNVQLSII